MISTGFFAKNNRQFTTADKILGGIKSAQSGLEKIPFLGQWLSIPFQILDQYQSIKTETINANIAGKISNSNMVDESDITSVVI